MPQSLVAPDCDRQLNFETKQLPNDIRRISRPGVNHVKHVWNRLLQGPATIFCGLGESWANRESERLDSFGLDSLGAQHIGTSLVWKEKIICPTAIPDPVDRNRIRNHNYAFVARVRSRDLLQQIWISRKD